MHAGGGEHTHTHACTHRHAHIMQTHTHITHTHARTCTHARAHTHTHTHTRTHTHTHTPPCRLLVNFPWPAELLAHELCEGLFAYQSPLGPIQEASLHESSAAASVRRGSDSTSRFSALGGGWASPVIAKGRRCNEMFASFTSSSLMPMAPSSGPGRVGAVAVLRDVCLLHIMFPHAYSTSSGPGRVAWGCSGFGMLGAVALPRAPCLCICHMYDLCVPHAYAYAHAPLPMPHAPSMPMPSQPCVANLRPCLAPAFARTSYCTTD